jgi:hypothetical protein
MSKRQQHYNNLILLSEELFNTFQRSKVKLNTLQTMKDFYTIEIELQDDFILNKNKLDLIFSAVENADYIIRSNVWDKIEIIFFYENF